MSFYERMNPSAPPGRNAWSAVINECLQGSQPPCAQDAYFNSAFTMNPPATLAAEYWSSLSNWAAHQEQIRLGEAKRQLAHQLYRTIDVEDLRAAALRQMYMEEEEWSQQQQQQQQQSNGFNGFSYHPAQSAYNFTLDARYEDPMHAGFYTIPPGPFAVYRDDAFAYGREQVDVEEEAVSQIHEQGPEGYYSNEQNQQDDVQDHTRIMSASETAKAQAVERMNGLATYVADLKAQMAEKMNSGEFTMDASTAYGYEQYSRTPAFFRARRSGDSQNHLSSAVDSQDGEISEGSKEQMPNRSTASGDSQTPDLYNDSQDQSVDSVNSLECSPDEPIFRSPDGPPLKILAPQPSPPRSAILQMTADETAEENYLYHGYGGGDVDALHWQLPDWLWYHKSQQGGFVDGVSYNFNYPPNGYAATPEFVEVRYDEEEPMEEEANTNGFIPPPLSDSEYHSGCTPRYFMDSQSPLRPEVREDVIRKDHEMSTFAGPMADPHEILRVGIYGIPRVYGRGRIHPPADIMEPSIFEPFIHDPAAGLNIIGREAPTADKEFDYSGTTPQGQESGRIENFSTSLTPPNRFRRPVDSDPLTPESPVFRKSTFPNPDQFDVHNANTEHLFTPSPRKPGSSPPCFVIHTRKSIRNKNRGQTKSQAIEAIKARRAAVDAYLGIPPSGLPVVLEWPTPEPETPPSSPYPYSVDTPSPSVLVHKRHLKIRRAKILAAKQPTMPAGPYTREHRAEYRRAQGCWN